MVMTIPVIIMLIIAHVVKGITNQKERQAALQKKIQRRPTIKFTLFKTKLSHVDNLYNGHFVDVKAFYTACFNRVPCVSFIGEIDTTTAFDFIMQHCKQDIVDTYQHSYYNYDAGKTFFNSTVIVLTQKRVVEIAGNYCHILHTPQGYDWSRWVMKELAGFRVQPINIATSSASTRILGFAGAADLN